MSPYSRIANKCAYENQDGPIDLCIKKGVLNVLPQPLYHIGCVNIYIAKYSSKLWLTNTPRNIFTTPTISDILSTDVYEAC